MGLKRVFNKYLGYHKFGRDWRKLNTHNSTSANNIFSLDHVSVGIGTYGGLKVFNKTNDVYLKIGNYCSIGEEVKFIVAWDHILNNISTFPFKAKVLHSCRDESVAKGDIIIDDDVWIGYGATILSGVHIGQGAVIAAGAIVAGDIPPYGIVGGVPAKVIKYRFSNKVIEQLLKVDFSKMDLAYIEKNINALYSAVTDENIKELISGLPKKGQ